MLPQDMYVSGYPTVKTFWLAQRDAECQRSTPLPGVISPNPPRATQRPRPPNPWIHRCVPTAWCRSRRSSASRGAPAATLTSTRRNLAYRGGGSSACSRDRHLRSYRVTSFTIAMPGLSLRCSGGSRPLPAYTDLRRLRARLPCCTRSMGTRSRGRAPATRVASLRRMNAPACALGGQVFGPYSMRCRLPWSGRGRGKRFNTCVPADVTRRSRRSA